MTNISIKDFFNAIILLDNLTINIHNSWKTFFLLHNEMLYKILAQINCNKYIIYPSINNIFHVFTMDLNSIKILFLGQDPYHNYNQANGLAFSINKNLPIPPSLNNIFKELKNEFPDRNYQFSHGDISRWFIEEKIFLLNSSLTVEHGKPGSHIKLWLPFTDLVIKYISEKNDNCVFLLLGEVAKLKIKYIKNKKKCIYGVHPSPLSVNRGFYNSEIFIKIEKKIGLINWNI